MLKKLWNDEVGAVVSAELVMVATILGIGMIVGLTSVRDAVVTELADVGAAIASINQSYTYGGVVGHSGTTAGSVYVDLQDFCDGANSLSNINARCVTVNTGATAEGGQ